MRILLARHGLTDWNIQNRFQGQSNIPLNVVGVRQAQALGSRLAGEPIDHIYASDLDRTSQTASAIAAHHQCPLALTSALRELHFGEWEGLTYEQIQESDPQGLETWNQDTLDYAPPGGESLKVLANRISTFKEDISTRHSRGTVLLVTHGGCLQVLLCLALEVSPQRYWQFRLSPASLSEIRFYQAGAIISLLNDRCHLNTIDVD